MKRKRPHYIEKKIELHCKFCLLIYGLCSLTTLSLTTTLNRGLNVKRQVAATRYNKAVNKYNAECGGDLDMWEGSGWIAKIDPYGWFQWRCRFYQGRRSSDDDRQISRGNGVMGPTGRWRNSLINKVLSSNKRLEETVEDSSISPKIRQLPQRWGYKLTVQDVKAFAKKKGLM